MDRQTIYFGQIPLETDLLKAQQNALVALAKFCAGVLGNTTIVNGFTCTPTGPASLNVILTAGEIYQIANLEAAAWSSLPSDITHSILKQGVQLDPLTFGITPPGTVGFSQVFLIEVQYADQDTGSVVLPYFNSANPASPFSGPANAGTAQNTIRKGIVASQVKAGIAAATGTQATPSADAGWTGLFTVTVANGAATITSGNIAQLASAPFIPVTLPGVPAGVQNSTWVYAVDTGTASNIVVNPKPAVASYGTGGLFIVAKAAAGPIAGGTVVNVSVLGNKSVVNIDGTPIQPNQWVAGSIVGLFYDGSQFQLAYTNFRQQGSLINLTAGKDWYVDASIGNDITFDGTAPAVSGSHGPFQTIQRAITETAKYNMNGFNHSIHVANGNYAPITLGPTNGSGTIIIAGNDATPNSCQINATAANTCAILQSGGNYNIDGFRLSATGAGTSDGLSVGFNGACVIGSVRFGPCTRYHMSSNRAATLTVTNGGTGVTIETAANAQAHMACTLLSTIIRDSSAQPALTILGAMTFSDAFILAQDIGLCQVVYSLITGAANVTGAKYDIKSNSVVDSVGGGISYYPGTIAGSASSGGQYI